MFCFKNRLLADILCEINESSIQILLKLFEQQENYLDILSKADSYGWVQLEEWPAAPCLPSILGTTEESHRECKVHKGESTEKTQFWAADVAMLYMSWARLFKISVVQQVLFSCHWRSFLPFPCCPKCDICDMCDIYGSFSPGRGKWAKSVLFFFFLKLHCDQTVWFFKVFSTVLKRLCPLQSKNTFVLVLAIFFI